MWLLSYVSLEQKAWHISSHGSMWHGCDPWLWCYWIPSPWGAPRWHTNLRTLLPCVHEPEREVWDGWPTFVRIHGSLLASIASYYTSSRWPFQIQEPQRFVVVHSYFIPFSCTELLYWMEALFLYLGLSDINLGTMVRGTFLLGFMPFQLLFCLLLPFHLIIIGTVSGVALAPARGPKWPQWVFFPNGAMCACPCAPIVLAYLDIKGEMVNLHFV